MAIERFEIYKREDGQTGWRAVAGNGEKVAGGEGYKRWNGAAGAVQLLLDIPPDVMIVDLTGGGRVELTAAEFREIVDGGQEEVELTAGPGEAAEPLA